MLRYWSLEPISFFPSIYGLHASLLGHTLIEKLGPYIAIRTLRSFVSDVFLIPRFYSSLVNNLTFKYKDVHAAAAEVIGLLMKQLAEVQKVKRTVQSSFL